MPRLTTSSFRCNLITKYSSFFQSWKTFAPEAVEEIERHENRGDFLAIYSRDKSSTDQRLGDIYRQNYQSLVTLPEFGDFRLQNVAVHGFEDSQFPKVEDLVEASDFWMSDHSR